MRSKTKSIVLWALAILVIAVVAVFDHDDDTAEPAKAGVKQSAPQDAGSEKP